MSRSAAEIFHEAREMPAEKRAGYLVGACGKDLALRSKVEALLKADAEAGEFLAAPTVGAQTRADSASSHEQAGTQIDRYKLLEQLGEGGMGTIWLAEQREPVKRRVALKIIKLGMDTKQVIARFEAERQALAMMDHPHIAKVLDAGATETGRPYFVMEYIKGIPILEYCDQEKVDTLGRLELFKDVCHAIQHAHQKGIIHRDIKPSNVLVTLHDGVPVPKVIDFGIAKATNSELTNKTLFTEHRQMIGTPAYMSPEQAEMSGLDIDTRSDIYSLGVLLYEMLTGTTPFDMQDLLSKGFGEMMRAIREDEPHKPSTRISTLGDMGTRTAQQRKVDVKKLGTILRGDLDWIVMKCLEKDRSRRYDTANGLAADIQRHLKDEPVTAGAPSAGYRMHKFVRRNRIQVIAASLVVLALLAGTLGASWGLIQKGRARSVELEHRLESEQRTAIDSARLGRNAEAVAALLSQGEEALRLGDTKKAKVVLDAAKKRAAEGGAEDESPRLERLLDDLGLLVELDAIDQLRWSWSDNRFAEHEVVMTRTREAFRRFAVDPDVVSIDDASARVSASAIKERVVSAMDRLLRGANANGVRAVLARVDADPYRDAVRDAVHARDRARLIALADQTDALAQPPGFTVFLGGDEMISVERRLELLQAAAIQRSGDVDLLMTLGTVSYSIDAEDSAMERMRWFQAAVAADPDNVAALNDLGGALASLGQVQAAVGILRKAIALDPTLANAHNNLGNALQNLGQLDEAIECFRKSLDLNPMNAVFQTNLGFALQARGQSDEATECFKRAIALNPSFSDGHVGLAIVLFEAGRLDEAAASFSQAIAINPNHTNALLNLSVVLRRMGMVDEAIVHLRRVVELEPKNVGALLELGALLCDVKQDYDGAHLCFERAVALAPNSVEARVNLGCALYGQGHLDEALACFRQAVAADPAHTMARLNLASTTAASVVDLIVHAAEPDSAEQIRLRKQALDSSREALELYAEMLRSGSPGVAAGVEMGLGQWQKDKAFAGLRDPITLAKFPAADQAAFARLWSDVAELLQRAEIATANADEASLMGATGAGAEDGTVAFLEESLAELRARLGSDHTDTIHAMGAVGRAHQVANKLELAVPYYEEMLERAKAKLGPADPLTLDSMFQLGVAYWWLERLDKSVPLFEAALQQNERAFGPNHPNTIKIAANLGVNYTGAGRLSEALPLLEMAYQASKERPGSEWIGGELLFTSIKAADPAKPGDVLKIATLIKELIANARKALPENSPQLAGQLAQFGLMLLELQAWNEAEPLIRESLAIREEVQPDAWTTFNAKSLLGAALLGQKKYAEAERLLLAGYRGMRDREASIPPQGETRIPEALERLVQLYEATGDASQAEEWRGLLTLAQPAPIKNP